MNIRKRIKKLSQNIKPASVVHRSQIVDPKLVARLAKALTCSGQTVDIREIFQSDKGQPHD